MSMKQPMHDSLPPVFRTPLQCLCVCSVCFLFRLWPLACFSVDLQSYVTGFQWDKAKYPTTLPLSCLTDLINKVSTNSNISKLYICFLYRHNIMSTSFEKWLENLTLIIRWAQWELVSVARRWKTYCELLNRHVHIQYVLQLFWVKSVKKDNDNDVNQFFQRIMKANSQMRFRMISTPNQIWSYPKWQ